MSICQSILVPKPDGLLRLANHDAERWSKVEIAWVAGPEAREPRILLTGTMHDGTTHQASVPVAIDPLASRQAVVRIACEAIVAVIKELNAIAEEVRDGER